MTDIPRMQETEELLEDARKYLVDYTEQIRITNHKEGRGIDIIQWRDYEILSLTIQDLLEHVKKLTDRIAELEKS